MNPLTLFLRSQTVEKTLRPVLRILNLRPPEYVEKMASISHIYLTGSKVDVVNKLEEIMRVITSESSSSVESFEELAVREFKSICDTYRYASI